MGIEKLAPALVKAQGAIEGATKGKKNDHFRSKYADLGACWDACRDALQANGLAVVQLPCEAPSGFIGLVTTIVHESGETMSERFFMPLKDATNPQAAGSALTYARRYALCAAIGICPVDDDGNKAAAEPARSRDPLPVAPPPVDWAKKWEEAWKAADTKDKKKAAYMEARNSATPEPLKTSLLTAWQAEIKSLR